MRCSGSVHRINNMVFTGSYICKVECNISYIVEKDNAVLLLFDLFFYSRLKNVF